MSNKFGRSSMKNMEHLDPRLIPILYAVLKEKDISVICGYRDEEEQTNAYENDFSSVPWPKSNHNKKPSTAVDILLYPQKYKATRQEWYELALLMLDEAAKRGILLRWGGMFKKTVKGKIVEFFDAGHFEIVEV